MFRQDIERRNRGRGRWACVCGLMVVAATPWILASGCPTGPGGTPTPAWQLVLSNLPGGLLSVSGTSATDVYAVGADPGDGKGPQVLHYNGQQWARLRTLANGDLWWISDRPINNSFFLGGDGGLILRYRPATGLFEHFLTPGTQTIFGVWGLTDDNVFAVGGDVSNPDTSGVIWRFNGLLWSVEDLSGVNAAGIPVAFKVWGRSANEVYVCGARGLILKYDGASWTQLTSGTTRTLFTVHGNNALAVAVGGFQSGVLLEQAGNSFTSAAPAGLLQTNGVFVPETGDAVAVGNEGSVEFRTAAGWQVQNTGLNLSNQLDYHAAWIDPDGGIWAVGGNIAGEPRTSGIVSHFGTQTIGTTLTD